MASTAQRYRAASPARIEQRGEPRYGVGVTRAGVGKPGDPPVDALLDDISIYGCRLRWDGDHAPGGRLLLRFVGRPPIAATLVWSDGGVVGCRFDQPIDTALVRSLTLRLA